MYHSPAFLLHFFCAASCVFHLLSVLQADFMLNYCCWPFFLSFFLFWQKFPREKAVHTDRAESGQIKTSCGSRDVQVTSSRSNNDKAPGTGHFREHQALLPPSDAVKWLFFLAIMICETVGFQGYWRAGKRRWTWITATKVQWLSLFLNLWNPKEFRVPKRGTIEVIWSSFIDADSEFYSTVNSYSLSSIPTSQWKKERKEERSKFSSNMFGNRRPKKHFWKKDLGNRNGLVFQPFHQNRHL